MIILRSVYILMPAGILTAFLWAPPAEHHGDLGRILFFHVPVAWVSVLSFILAGIYSIRYLLRPESKPAVIEARSRNAAVLGLAFTICAVITGSLWAKESWGSYWNWDPRQTSVVMILLIYTAYLALFSALAGNRNRNRGKICSAYLIVAMVSVPFFYFIVPRLNESLHPGSMSLDSVMRLTLLFMVVCFTLLYLYLFALTNRISRVEIVLEERMYE